MYLVGYIDHIGDFHPMATAANESSAKWFVAFTQGIDKESIEWEDDLEHDDRFFYSTDDVIYTIESLKHIS